MLMSKNKKKELLLINYSFCFRLTLQKAEAMVQQMKDEGRYSQDIFGN